MPTLTAEVTRVRNLLGQTSTTNTQFTDTVIGDFLQEGRRIFARILPQEMIPGLKTTSNLSLSSGFAAFPSDFLRHVVDGEQLVDSVQAREISAGERWRLKFLSGNDLVKGGSADKYWFSHKTGLNVYPTSATTFTFQYIKKPTDLSGSANEELPADLNDLVVEYAFQKTQSTARGDLEIAVAIAKERGFYLQNIKV